MGLGLQMATGLAEMGAKLLVLCARNRERCEEAAESLRSLGRQALALGCDVKDKAAIEHVMEQTLAKFGRIDILINNAGVSWGAPVEDMTLEQWDKVISTNLTGTFLFCQAAGKAMVAQRSGKIINIASVAGRVSVGGVAGDRIPREQGWRYCVHQGSGVQVGAPQHPGERHRAGMVSNPHVGLDYRAPQKFPAGEDSARPLRRRL